MRRLVVNLDDELDLWLQKEMNQNETIRKALYLYKNDIKPDTVEGMRLTYQVIAKCLKEIDSKVDYLGKRVQP